MRHLSLNEQILLSKRLAFLMHAHIPLVEALRIIATQTRPPKKALRFEHVLNTVAEGKPLSHALETEKMFRDFSLHLIHLGEMSGTLADNLTYLAEELHKKRELRKKVLSALWYPLIISVATLGITGALTTYIFPKLAPVFISTGTVLPLTTRLLIATAAWLGTSWPALLVGFVLIPTLTLWLYRHYEKVQRLLDAALLYTPLARRMARAYYTATIARTLALLLNTQGTLPDALATCARMTTNTIYAQALAHLAEQTRAGKSLAQECAQFHTLFPEMFIHLVAVGESAGNLAEVLSYLASAYEAEVDERSKLVAQAVEPALMLVMGLLVGLIAIAIITPIYSITAHLQPH